MLRPPEPGLLDAPPPGPRRRGLAFAFSEAPELEQGRLRFPNLGFLLLLAEFSCKIPQAERGAA